MTVFKQDPATGALHAYTDASDRPLWTIYPPNTYINGKFAAEEKIIGGYKVVLFADGSQTFQYIGGIQ